LGTFNSKNLKKSSRRQIGELCPNLPKSSIPLQKITVDNQARFRYQDSYWIRLIDASICWAAADADTQFANFDSSASEKQLLIFLSLTRTDTRSANMTKSSRRIRGEETHTSKVWAFFPFGFLLGSDPMPLT